MTWLDDVCSSYSSLKVSIQEYAIKDIEMAGQEEATVHHLGTILLYPRASVLRSKSIHGYIEAEWSADLIAPSSMMICFWMIRRKKIFHSTCGSTYVVMHNGKRKNSKPTFVTICLVDLSYIIL